MNEVYATDNGPECWRCRGTIWRYNMARQPLYWFGDCVTCGVVEGAFFVSPTDNVRDIRAAHEKFLNSAENGDLSTNGQAYSRPINLEGLTDCALEKVATHPGMHELVRRMAGLLQNARAKRLAGRIGEALRLERKIDELYKVLPLHLRW